MMTATLWLQRLLCAGLLLVLAGCSIYRPPGSEPAPVETRPDPTVVTPAPETSPPEQPRPAPVPPDSGAARASGPLLARAETATARGDYEAALALLERAQRIDPASAEVYLHLARTYAAQGQTERARATAERGMLYCRGDRECASLRALIR